VNTLRTFIVFAILSAVGYGVYATLTHQPPPPPPEIAGHEWSESPNVEMPGGPSGMPAVGVAPSGGVPPGLGNPLSSIPGQQQPIPLDAGPNQQSPTGVGPVASAEGYPEAPQFGSPAGAPPYPQDPALAGQPLDGSVADPGAGVASPAAPGYPAASVPDAMPGAAEAPPYPGPHAPPGAADPAAFASSGDDRYSQSQAHIPANGAGLPAGGDVQLNGPANGQPGTTPSDPNAGQAPAAAGAAAAGVSFEAVMSQVQAQLDQGRLADAHLELSRWYQSPQLTPAQQAQVHELLEPPYEVQPGDNLERVAKLYEVPWQLLAKINGITNPQQLQPGQSLKVVRGPFHASVELQSFTLTVWLGERYAGCFPVGIGRDLTTPEGNFQVLNKLENPPYHGSDAVVAADDPNNPLGERWIDLGNHIGIHGTTEQASVGQAESRGCIRLSERDVEDVYDILSVGSSVSIRR
jgi:lipoprotein-anchoring transpeptidase ErfK/SrfK